MFGNKYYNSQLKSICVSINTVLVALPEVQIIICNIDTCAVLGILNG